MHGRTPLGTSYHVSGKEDATAVVLIHGLGLNHKMWQWHEPELGAQYRVVSYDLLGHGESAPAEHGITLTVFSEQLRELLDHLAIERCIVVGFSLGGMINRRFALDHAERVLAIAIFNSPHERTPEAQRLVEARAAEVADGGSDATIESALERWFTPAFREQRPDVIALVREWRKANDPQSYPQCCMVLASGVTELIRPQPPLNLPVLVMTAQNDSGSTPAMSEAIAREITGAKTIVVPRLQHMGLTEEPLSFTQPLLTFLREELQ